MTASLVKSEVLKIANTLKKPTQAFINGVFVNSLSNETFATLNPSNGKTLAEIASCNADDVDRAVIAARESFESGVWSRSTPAERKRVMLKFADLIELHTDELAVLESLESGKPVSDCYSIDVPETVKTIRWHAEAADKLYDQLSPSGPDVVAMIVREPIGVVAAVLPWNFPLMMAAWKLGPALITGNSVILKPAEQTSMTTLRLAELATEAGVPGGVLNVVTGFGETTGQALGMHLDVDAVTFTGSTATGRRFLEYSARSNLKRIILECGGKNPQIVMPDAGDLDRVADNVVSAAFWNMGQNCSAGSRLIVHSSIKDALLSKIVERISKWSVGDPLDPDTMIGPLVEQAHLDKVLGYIESGCKEAKSVALNGGRVLEGSGGYYVSPVIFDCVQNDMIIAQEEIFGPVLAVICFDTEAQAIQIANDTCYGLAASIWTESLKTSHRLSRAIKAGTITVNVYGEGDNSTPFGGYRQSGFGGRDKSIFAHDQYTEMKTVWIDNS